MKNLTRFPELGDLVIVETYVFYDEPLIFAAKNERERLFLGLLSRDAVDERRWLYAETSDRRWQEVRSGGIALHDAFQKAEAGFVFEVRLDKATNELAAGGWRRCDSLTADELPDPEVRLKLSTLTQPAWDASRPAKIARQVHREVLAVRSEFPGQTRSEAPIAALGALLSHIQSLVLAVGESMERAKVTAADASGKAMRRFSKSLERDLGLNAAAVFGGSFGVELHAERGADLFDCSPAHGVLAEVLVLLTELKDDAALTAHLRRLPGRSTANLQGLLARIVASTDRLEVVWGSPVEGSGQAITIDRATAQVVLERLKVLLPDEPSYMSVLGSLQAASLTSKLFELSSLADGSRYRGRVDDEAWDEFQRISFGKIYEATLRVTVVRGAAEEQDKTKYELVALSDQEHGPDHSKSDEAAV